MSTQFDIGGYLIDAVAEHAPSDAGLAKAFPRERTDAVFDGLVARLDGDDGARQGRATAGSRRLSRRGLITGVGLAAAAAAVAIAVPAILPHGSPGSASTAGAMERLAVIALSDTSPVIGAGQFLHTITVSSESGAKGDVTYEQWTASDGTSYIKETGPGRWHGLAAPDYARHFGGDDWINRPSPAYVGKLPNDPIALRAFLDQHVSGSSSHEEAIFVAISDMLSTGYVPAAQRAASLRVAGSLPHVTVTNGRDQLGRGAIVATFRDDSIRPGAARVLYFDPKTARVLGSAFLGSPSFQGVITLSEIVDTVPAEVLTKLATVDIANADGSTGICHKNADLSVECPQVSPPTVAPRLNDVPASTAGTFATTTTG